MGKTVGPSLVVRLLFQVLELLDNVQMAHHGPPKFKGNRLEVVASLYMAVGQNQWYHFGVGEFTTHFRTYLSGWILTWPFVDLTGFYGEFDQFAVGK